MTDGPALIVPSFADDTAELAETYEEVSRDRQFLAGRRLVDSLAIAPGERVLDVGCGTGLLAEHIAGIVGQAGYVLGLDPLVCARRIGGDVAYESAGRVGRTVISLFGTPARVARHLGSMWGQLYDSGVVEGTYDDGTGVLGVRRREWRGHDPITCITLLGSLERIVEHMSGVELRSAQRVLCLSDSGGDECRFEVRLRTR